MAFPQPNPSEAQNILFACFSDPPCSYQRRSANLGAPPPPGALVTDLAPSAIAIGCYFCVADVIMISQCLYYNALNARRRNRQASAPTTGGSLSEEEPLLARRQSTGSANGGLPGSQRQDSFRRDSTGFDPLQRIVTGEDNTPQRSAWVTNTLSLVFVYVLGTAAWFISREVIGPGAASDPADVADPAPADKPVVAVGMVLGYISALCYLCARIPQIIKNWRQKSTEGMFRATKNQGHIAPSTNTFLPP